MSDQRRRLAATAVILLVGGLWLGWTRQAAAPRPTAAGHSTAGGTAPWATAVTDDTPLVKFVAAHPSPLGRRAVEALKAHQAVILVGLAAGGRTDPQILQWIGECSDYCRMLGTRLDYDPADTRERELLAFLEASELTAPCLIGIGMSGEVKRRVGGHPTRKQIIDVFAEVTGSCGVECETGLCN